MEIPDIERTFKGTIICLAGGVPLYGASLFPKKFKSIPYTIGTGLEALGLYEIYQGIWGKSEELPEEFNWDASEISKHGRVWMNIEGLHREGFNEIKRPFPGLSLYIKYRHNIPENDLPPGKYITTYLFGTVTEAPTGRRWKLQDMIRPYEYLVEKGLGYYQEAQGWYAWIPWASLKVGNTYSIDVAMTDYLTRNLINDNWWEDMCGDSNALKHNIAISGTYNINII